MGDKQFGGDFHKFYFDHVAFEEPLRGEAKTSEWRHQVSQWIYKSSISKKILAYNWYLKT